MKNAPTLLALALSAAANLGLGALVYSHRSGSHSLPSIPVAPASAVQPSVAKPNPSPADVASPASDSTHAVTETDAAYISRLRADGFPPEIIRTLVLTRLRQKYADRLRSARHPREHAYWRDSPIAGTDRLTREERAAINAIERELMAEAKTLLGADGLLTPEEKAGRERTLGNLSLEKIQRIDAIAKDYDELSAQIRDRAKGLILRADREELRLLEKERRADLAAALTPEELLEYDLRASPSAPGIRQRLQFFEPSEDEYRAIAKLQVALDQTYGRSNLSGEEQDRRRAAEKNLPDQIRAVLSPERYADYVVTTDGNFRDTAHVLRDDGLELSTVKEIVALQQSFAPRIESVRQQSDLTPDQRAAALAALAQEATGVLTAKLGATTFAHYENYAGAWLTHLRPTPKR